MLNFFIVVELRHQSCLRLIIAITDERLVAIQQILGQFVSRAQVGWRDEDLHIIHLPDDWLVLLTAYPLQRFYHF